MKISVLMSVYKAEKPEYLNKALHSVWEEQTYKPHEIVLIADGPLTPDLDDVIENWQKNLVNSFVLIRNELNEGLTKSLNKGLKYVTGDCIARMDSDDISDPKRFELQSKYLVDNPEIDIVGGWIQEFDDFNSCLNIRKYPSDFNFIKKYICKASPLAHPTVMMRRRMFDEGLNYNESYRTSQDLALWFDALDRGYKISNLPSVTLYFRLADDVFKRRNRKKAINEFKIYMNGIYRLYGLFSFSYIYPVSRLMFRLMPEFIIKGIYNSKLRGIILSNK